MDGRAGRSGAGALRHGWQPQRVRNRCKAKRASSTSLVIPVRNEWHAIASSYRAPRPSPQPLSRRRGAQSQNRHPGEGRDPGSQRMACDRIVVSHAPTLTPTPLPKERGSEQKPSSRRRPGPRFATHGMRPHRRIARPDPHPNPTPEGEGLRAKNRHPGEGREPGSQRMACDRIVASRAPALTPTPLPKERGSEPKPSSRRRPGPRLATHGMRSHRRIARPDPHPNPSPEGEGLKAKPSPLPKERGSEQKPSSRRAQGNARRYSAAISVPKHAKTTRASTLRASSHARTSRTAISTASSGG